MDDVLKLLRTASTELMKKEGGIPHRSVGIMIQEAISILSTTKPDDTGTRLARIEEAVRNTETSIRVIEARNTGPAVTLPDKARTYAEIARKIPNEKTIRIRLNDAPSDEQKNNGRQLLQRVRATIPQAIAVRALSSGDIDIHVASAQEKDMVTAGPDGAGYKIIRKDYMVEVMGVDLSLPVNSGRADNNTEVIRELVEANKRTVPGLVINRIKWMHETKPQNGGTATQDTTQIGDKQTSQRIKTRGSLIIGVATLQMMEMMIRNGFVVGALMHNVRLYEHSVGIKQCFKCQGWGHITSVCAKQARCGHCAGSHDTRDCKEKDKKQCVNCKGQHASWNKGACKVFGAYLGEIKGKRIALAVQSMKMREIADEGRFRFAGSSSSFSNSSNSSGYSGYTSISSREIQEGQKRARAAEGTTARPGRPTFTTKARAQARRDPKQRTLGMNPVLSPPLSSSQGSTSQDSSALGTPTGRERSEADDVTMAVNDSDIDELDQEATGKVNAQNKSRNSNDL